MSKHKKMRFTTEEDEQLIEHVSSYELIWNISHSDYKSGQKKDKVWLDIADKIGRNRDECQRRWKSIRDHYKRQKKDEIGKTGRKRAAYWDRLSFLDLTEDEREMFSNISFQICEETQNSTTQEDCIDSKVDVTPHILQETLEQPPVNNAQPKQGIENSELLKYLKETKDENTKFQDSVKQLIKCDELDDVDLFFKSIAISVKKFKPHLITKTKLKVLEVVSEMEQLQYSSNSNH